MFEWTGAKDLENILNPFVNLNLECDGLTRVFSAALSYAEIKHNIRVGVIQDLNRMVSIEPHLWIALPDGRLIDYRARMWLGNWHHIPHGVFHTNDYKKILYKGDVTDPVPADDYVAYLLASLEGIKISDIGEKLLNSSLSQQR